MAIAYAALAVRVSRSGPQHGDNLVSLFLVLIAGMLTGSAFSYDASDAGIYGIGRVLSFVSAGFIPLVFYSIYRGYTVGPPKPLWLAILAVIPVVTTGIAVTNSLHNALWVAVETASGLQTSLVTEHYWYRVVYAPFIYGLFAYCVIAMLGRLPTIAPAHRKMILLLLTCAALPFAVSILNTFLKVGPPEFPFTSVTLGLLWPFFAYASIKLRVHEFSPVAYQTLFDHVRDPIFVVDKEQRIICANRAAQQLLNGNERELVGQKLWQDFPAARAILEQARELDLTQTLRMDTRNVYEVSVGPLNGTQGQNIGMVVVCRDVTERRHALSQLADSEHLIRTLIETSSNGILRFSKDDDRGFTCVFANRAAETFAGTLGESIVGLPLTSFGFLKPEKLAQHFVGGRGTSSQISFEVAADSDAGETWTRVVGEPVGEDFSVTLVDITQRKRNEDKMLADALHDPLTGVLNRRGFEQQAGVNLQRCTEGAVLYLDLNGFKAINDEYGHQAGDALLKAFGHRLEFCLRPEDVLGRLGGDEFAIVLPGVDVTDVRHIAERLVQTASDAYIIQGQEIRCAASVGIALKPKHGEELWHLLSVADQAMYTAKKIPADEAANDRAAYIQAATAS